MADPNVMNAELARKLALRHPKIFREFADKLPRNRLAILKDVPSERAASTGEAKALKKLCLPPCGLRCQAQKASHFRKGVAFQSEFGETCFGNRLLAGMPFASEPEPGFPTKFSGRLPALGYLGRV